MSISTHMYASQMPKWHNSIQSELTRSLLLAGMPPALPTLMPTAPSTDPFSQSASANQGSEPRGTEGTKVQPEGIPILLLDGQVHRAAAEAASAQLHPALLHQAMVLTITADLGPADIGACEPDSSGSDTSESELTGPEDEGLVAAGFEKMLVIAVLAAFKSLDQCFMAPESAGLTNHNSDDDSFEAFAAAFEVKVFMLFTCIHQTSHDGKSALPLILQCCTSQF